VCRLWSERQARTSPARGLGPGRIERKLVHCHARTAGAPRTATWSLEISFRHIRVIFDPRPCGKGLLLHRYLAYRRYL